MLDILHRLIGSLSLNAYRVDIYVYKYKYIYLYLSGGAGFGLSRIQFFFQLIVPSGHCRILGKQLGLGTRLTKLLGRN